LSNPAASPTGLGKRSPQRSIASCGGSGRVSCGAMPAESSAMPTLCAVSGSITRIRGVAAPKVANCTRERVASSRHDTTVPKPATAVAASTAKRGTPPTRVVTPGVRLVTPVGLALLGVTWTILAVINWCW
jgi:hypothetical protein